MLRPQMLEAIFVAGSVFFGLTGGPDGWEHARWNVAALDPAACPAAEKARFAFDLVSGHGKHGQDGRGQVRQPLR